MDKVKKLRGVYYHMKNKPDERKLGLIAQELEKVIPEVVKTDESEEKLKSVSYGNLVGLLIESIKHLEERIIELENRKN
jgi:hypothetical protein